MHHFIGVGLGALVTYVLLVILVPGPTYDQFVPAVVIGAIVAALWPWVIAFLLARRVKNRRDEQIQSEVERQVADQNKS